MRALMFCKMRNNVTSLTWCMTNSYERQPKCFFQDERSWMLPNEISYARNIL